WFVLDNGSTHGTFIITSDASLSEKDPKRLSKQKKASQLFRLHHLDTILIASSKDPVLSFQVHIHPKFPTSCQSCALRSDESNRIRLALPTSTQNNGETLQMLGAIDLDERRHAFMNPMEVKADRGHKRKAEMARLWNQFFEDDSPPWASLKKKRMTMTMGGVKNLGETKDDKETARYCGGFGRGPVQGGSCPSNRRGGEKDDEQRSIKNLNIYIYIYI
ncbi:hypothetical protein PPACK8108_LOCUS5536, partial [Phakopsora pachyrhizi]